MITNKPRISRNFRRYLEPDIKSKRSIKISEGPSGRLLYWNVNHKPWMTLGFDFNKSSDRISRHMFALKELRGRLPK